MAARSLMVSSARCLLMCTGVDTYVRTLSLRPLVVEVENFLNVDEAQHIIARAKPHMAKSGVALKDADIGKAAKEFRTSSQYFLPTTRTHAQAPPSDQRCSHWSSVPGSMLRSTLLSDYGMAFTCPAFGRSLACVRVQVIRCSRGSTGA